MKNYIDVEKTIKEINYITCDKCDTVVHDKDLENEIVSIAHTFGYGSNHDGTNISFDICEKCFMEIIKGIDYQSKEVSLWDK